MPKTVFKDIFKNTQKNHYAIGQFNFSTTEQLRGIFEAAKELKSPIILGTSEGESKFIGLEEAVSLVAIFKNKYCVSAFLHLDHGKDLNWLKKAIDCGYDSVHFDGSGLPLEENIKQTKKAAGYAKKRGVLVEGELGAIKGESVLHKGEIKLGEKDFTSVAEVKNFVKKTGIDSLAIAIGSTHGIYEKEPNIDFKRLEDIKKETNAFLVLHGGSGIPDSEIREAIRLGISKINFNTELRIVWKEGLESTFKENPGEIKPYKILPKVQIIIQKKVGEKINLLGSKNKE